jgi:RNA-directed DNA polymerase
VVPGPGLRLGSPCGDELQEGTLSNAQTLVSLSPQLLKVVERAQREPEGRFHSLAHLIDVSALERAYHRMRKDAAVGVDGITKEQYGQALESNLRDLHARMKAKRYRHQPIRRVTIPKEQGKTRPIGISAFEDKWVQDAVREVLEAIYEQDFLACSYGFHVRDAGPMTPFVPWTRSCTRARGAGSSRPTSCPSSTAWIAPS